MDVIENELNLLALKPECSGQILLRPWLLIFS